MKTHPFRNKKSAQAPQVDQSRRKFLKVAGAAAAGSLLFGRKALASSLMQEKNPADFIGTIENAEAKGALLAFHRLFLKEREAFAQGTVPKAELDAAHALFAKITFTPSDWGVFDAPAQKDGALAAAYFGFVRDTLSGFAVGSAKSGGTTPLGETNFSLASSKGTTLFSGSQPLKATEGQVAQLREIWQKSRGMVSQVSSADEPRDFRRPFWPKNRNLRA